MLEVKDLSIEFLDRSSPERVLNHLNLHMEPGEIVGLVGESGSGKTMTAQAVAGLLPGHAVIKSGEIRLNGQDLLHCTKNELRNLQGNEIAMIFQEPMTSLNPVKMCIRDSSPCGRKTSHANTMAIGSILESVSNIEKFFFLNRVFFQ